jgi:maleylpyruvate isomerase
LTALDEARNALRDRLGGGARYDDPTAPAKELAWARSGTAYFARKLNELTDSELLASSFPGGSTRRRVVAELSYQARALAQYIEWARMGIEDPKIDPFASIADDVALAVTLQAGALRHLFQHSEVHLNVEWRDLDAEGWNATFQLQDRTQLTARQTAWIRANSIWQRAVDLCNGGSFDDFPAGLVDALLLDAATNWNGETSYILRPNDRDLTIKLGHSSAGSLVVGSAANLARWITGRGVRELTGESLSVRPAGRKNTVHFMKGLRDD